MSFSNVHSDSSIDGEEDRARTLCLAINALDILSNALRQARQHSATNGFTLLNAIFPPDSLKYLEFAASVADRFVKTDVLHNQPVSEDTTRIGPFAAAAFDESVAAQNAIINSTHSPSATTAGPYYEQSYPDIVIAEPESVGIQWPEDISADPDYTEQSSELLGDPVSPVSSTISDSDHSVMSRNSASETNSFAFDSSSQSPEFTVEEDYIPDPGFTLEQACDPNSDYQLPMYALDDVDFQQTRQLYAHAEWLAKNQEQISEDLGKSPLFSSPLADCTVSLAVTPIIHELFLALEN